MQSSYRPLLGDKDKSLPMPNSPNNMKSSIAKRFSSQTANHLSTSPTKRSTTFSADKHIRRTVLISTERQACKLENHNYNTMFATAMKDRGISNIFSRRNDPRRSAALPRSSVFQPRPFNTGKSSSPPILFYHKDDPYYGFTNFSSHPVMYKGKRYPTSEHLFQSFKFHPSRPDLAEHIRTCSERPSVAFSEARRFQPEVRPDWKQVNIRKMDETLFHKFTQHKSLQNELLATGDVQLIEDSDKDAFWGVGADRQGRNELGKCLERLRRNLRCTPSKF